MSSHHLSSHHGGSHYLSSHYGRIGITPPEPPFTPDDVPHPPGSGSSSLPALGFAGAGSSRVGPETVG